MEGCTFNGQDKDGEFKCSDGTTPAEGLRLIRSRGLHHTNNALPGAGECFLILSSDDRQCPVAVGLERRNEPRRFYPDTMISIRACQYNEVDRSVHVDKRSTFSQIGVALIQEHGTPGCAGW